MYNYEYPITFNETYGHSTIDAISEELFETLESKISNAFSNDTISFTKLNNVFTASFDRELSNAEENDLDNIVHSYEDELPTRILEAAKWDKIQEIKVKNKEVLEVAGFEFPAGSGRHFCLTPVCRSTWLEMLIALQNGILTFPQKVRDLDENEFIITDPDMLGGFFQAGTARQAYIMNSTVALVKQVRACTTVEAVEAIVDDRV